MRLIIAGGGTGGHLFPGIAIAEELKGRETRNEVLFVGTEKGIEARVLPRLGWPVKFISAEGMKGKGVTARARALLKLIPGFFESMRIIRAFKPDVVLGVGGYASAPMVMGARFMGVRTAIHEQNALPGVTNRILGKVVNIVFVSFLDSTVFFPNGKVVVSGNPLRKEILEGLKEGIKAGGRKSILVFGGSLGAHRINTAILEMVKHLDEAHSWTIVHQTGEKDLEEVKEGYRKAGFRVKNAPFPPGMGPGFKTAVGDAGVEDSKGEFDIEVRPFIDDMASAYREADMVICRAGATTVAELTAAGRPAILIPYPFAADDHQRVNAESLVKTGGVIMILEKDLTGERLAAEVKRIFDDEKLLINMGEKVRGLARLDAAGVLVDGLYDLGKGKG